MRLSLHETTSDSTRPYASLTIKDANLSFSRDMDKLNPSRVQYIIIHHTGAAVEQAPEIIHNYHKNTRGWAGAGYHYYVRRNGDVYSLRPTDYAGVHTSGYNSKSIGICFEGNYDIQTLTSVQLNAGKQLIAYVMSKFNIKSGYIKKHRDYASTSCPGSKFPMETLLNGISEYSPNNVHIDKVKTSTSESGDSIFVSSDLDTYVVKKGDTMYGIAKKLGVGYQTLLSFNSHIKDASVILPGQLIYYRTNTVSMYDQMADSTMSAADAYLEIAEYAYNVAAIEADEAERYKQTLKHQSTLKFDGDGNKVLDFMSYDVKMPGYHPALIVIDLPGGVRKSLPFLISPSNMSDNRSNSVQSNKTSAGWFLYKLGMELGQLSFSGYMLDTKNEMERHAFLQQYKQYIVDKRNSNGEIKNENIVSVYMEGIQYTGYVLNLGFNKSSVQPFLYQYSIQFLVVDDRYIHTSDAPDVQFKNIMAAKARAAEASVTPLAPGVAKTVVPPASRDHIITDDNLKLPTNTRNTINSRSGAGGGGGELTIPSVSIN